MRIIWSPLAIDRVSEIAEYIAQDKPSAAVKWIDEIFFRVEQLEELPEYGRIVPEIENDHIREKRSIYPYCPSWWADTPC